MPDAPQAEVATETGGRLDRVAPLLPLALGVAMTLAVAGYRFGESNHAVYLLDALRQNDPGLLTNDWWTRSTLQYHFVFNKLSAWLMRLGVIEPAFLCGYLGLVILMHAAWRRLTLALGGTDAIYLVSVILFQLTAGGTGLGMYQFTQDSAFLPSNVANVAMLWGVVWWVSGRRGLAGFGFGLAGLFHLNHALAGIGLWVCLNLLERLRRRTPSPPYSGGSAIGSLALVALALPAIVPAVKTVLTKTASLPLSEFVDLYVRLRHPHHYDPSSWPFALWISFLIPIVLAIPAYGFASRWRIEAPELRSAADVFCLFLAMLAVALLGAGIWFVSEPLVQMSLYRFSIFPKLLSCVAVAWLLLQYPAGRVVVRGVVFAMLLLLTAAMFARVKLPPFVATNAVPLWLFTLFAAVALLRPRVLGWGRVAFGTLTTVCVVASLALTWSKLGLAHPGLRGDDAGYMELCRWAQRNTPRDAVFLVPPDEQSFRLHARRAIVVNFKNVPQLSGELGEWRDRLETVLDVDDLRSLPRPFHRTLDAIRGRYGQLSSGHLADVALRYGARYVVTVRPLHIPGAGTPVFSNSEGTYFLYDLGTIADNGSQASPLNVVTEP